MKPSASFLISITLLALALVLALFDAQPGGLAEMLALQAVSIPLIPRTKDELLDLANPQTGPEVVPFAAFDTEDYVSTVTTELNFFATVKQDRNVSNMPTAGQFPAPIFFEPYYGMFDILIAPTAVALDVWADYWALLFGDGAAGAPTIELTLDAKGYLRVPVSMWHGTGGPTGFGYAASFDGNVGAEYANNSVPDGGWCFGGTPMIPPTSSFGITLRYSAALTLLAAEDVPLRVTLLGAQHRKML